MKITWAFFLLSLCSCLSLKIKKDIHATETDFQDHVGIIIYDPAKDKKIFSHNEDKYFTPASNTKILTLFAALEVLGDSLPSLYYHNYNDSLIFWGSGDPSFLNHKLPQSDVYDFLKNSDKELFYSDANFYDYSLGPGWAWDDYPYSFSAERSPMPIYGNTLNIIKVDDKKYPSINSNAFKPLFYLEDSSDYQTTVKREYGKNTFYYSPGQTNIDKEVPFRYDPLLTSQILTDTLGKPVRLLNKQPNNYIQTMYHPAPDSIYRVMMQESDNLMAEQLMLLVGGVISDSLTTEKAIQFITANYFKSAPDQPIWRDGSGLSRYNLVTPRFIVWLWKELLHIHGKEYLFSLLATGGESGTLKNYYKNDPPYVFGKTGTLSNNHNLSGFLITAKGKLLIFSIMNNNYPTSSAPVKKRMEQILHKVYETY